MPYGISWGVYLRFVATAFVTTAAGAQAVHLVYRPLDDLEERISAKETELLEQRDKLMVLRTNPPNDTHHKQ